MFELSVKVNGGEKSPRQFLMALFSTALAFFQSKFDKDELGIFHIKDPHKRKWALFDALIGCIEQGNDAGVLTALRLGADVNLYDMYDDMPLYLAVLPENRYKPIGPACVTRAGVVFKNAPYWKTGNGNV